MTERMTVTVDGYDFDVEFEAKGDIYGDGWLHIEGWECVQLDDALVMECWPDINDLLRQEIQKKLRERHERDRDDD